MTRTRVPRRPVAAVCPAPSPCPWCHGSGAEPYDDSGLSCLACDGAGFPPAVGDLGPTRTHRKGRPFTYEPGRRRLAVTRGRDTTAYTLTEIPVDRRGFTGRAWEVVREDTGEVRYAYAAADSENHDCTCEGETYKASERANERAAAVGAGLVPTAGCVHLDAVLVLMRAGWLDLEGDDR